MPVSQVPLALAALLALAAVRVRLKAAQTPPAPAKNADKTPGPTKESDASHAIFASTRFSDQAILAQLTSLEHQVLVAAHGSISPSLAKLGPCIVSLARHLIDREASTRTQAIALTATFLASSHTPPGLAQCAEGVLAGMCDAAQSYLARSTPPEWSSGSLPLGGVSITTTSGARLRAVEFLAKGSAGVVYAAGDDAANRALKRIFPTQRESAENEYRIANRLKGAPSCLAVEDFAQDQEGVLWLVLPRILSTPGVGVDLCDFILAGYFQSHAKHAREVVQQLLLGLDHIASRGIVLRDVKPDNVLVSLNAEEDSIMVFWSDFGLAVDLGTDFANVRAPRGPYNDQALARADVLGWWYDICKLVPRPKWQARRPPERAFQKPLSSYDTYMLGIVIASMALRVDLPHIDASLDKLALERILGEQLPGDYLISFQLVPALAQHSRKLVQEHFNVTFGSQYGQKYFDLVLQMLATDPKLRPSPLDALAKLY